MTQGNILDKCFVLCSIGFICIFFFAIEWRWELILLGMPDLKPHVAAACFSVLLIFLGFYRIKKQTLSFWILLFLVIYFVLVAVLNLIELLCTNGYDLYTEFGIWFINIALFIVASDRDVWRYVQQHQKMVVLLYMFYVLPIFFLLFSSGCATESHFNLRIAIWISGMANLFEYGVSYQSFGDKIAILTFVILSLPIVAKLKTAVVIIALSTLYVVGSKARMVGFIFACVSYYVILLGLNKRYLKFASIMFISICLLCSGLVYIIDNSSFQDSDNWLIRTLARGRGDISVSGRRLIEEDNEKTRSSRILLGDYKFDNKLGRPGSYTHSAWGIVDYYGLPIFIITVGIWLYLLFKLLLAARKTPIAKAALMSMLFYTLLFSIARFPPVSYLTYWTLGMSITGCQDKNKV